MEGTHGLAAQSLSAADARGSKIDPFTEFIDEILVADLTAPRKRRHTMTGIYHRLIDKCGVNGMPYSVLGCYVRQRKPEIAAEHGCGPVNVFVPQTHRLEEESRSTAATWRVARGELVTSCLYCFRIRVTPRSAAGAMRPSSSCVCGACLSRIYVSI